MAEWEAMMTLSIGQRNRTIWQRHLPAPVVLAAVISFGGVIFFAWPSCGCGGKEKKIPVAMTQINVFGQAIEMFKQQNGYYPGTEAGLQTLVTKPEGATNWHSPYLDSIPLDPWGHAYIYERPGKHATNSYDIISMGPDGRLGGGDDINSWQLSNAR
jgi:general secretion pathway protein G